MRVATAIEQHGGSGETSRYAKRSPTWNSRRRRDRAARNCRSTRVEIETPTHFHLVNNFIGLAATAIQARFFEGLPARALRMKECCCSLPARRAKAFLAAGGHPVPLARTRCFPPFFVALLRTTEFRVAFIFKNFNSQSRPFPKNFRCLLRQTASCRLRRPCARFVLGRSSAN